MPYSTNSSMTDWVRWIGTATILISMESSLTSVDMVLGSFMTKPSIVCPMIVGFAIC